VTGQRKDLGRTRRERRARVSGMPAHVALPLTVAVGLVLGSSVAADWLGLGTGGVAAVALVAAVVAAVITHRTVGSLAAGAGILLAQPYQPGEQVHVYVPSLGRTVDAEVVRIGAANTTLLVRHPDNTDGLVVVPNNRMLRPPVEPGSAEKSKQA